MNKFIHCSIVLSLFLASCAGATPVPGTVPPGTQLPSSTQPPPSETPLPATLTPSSEPSLTPTDTPVPPSPTPAYPPEGYGPDNFPADVNPLTGLKVANPALLERRPVLVKISNLPRSNRPQWGLSLADIVFEYYTEEGCTRFAAIFYGQDAEIAGPIRSGRFFDTNVVTGYKAIFVFGGAYLVEMNRFNRSEFSDRMITQLTRNTPLYRYDPNGFDFLIGSTALASAFITSGGVENGRQDLGGMTFKLEPPSSGQAIGQVIVRYSGSIYNRWDYDAASGTYLRFADTVDDFDINKENYKQLTDRLTGLPISAANLVVLYVPHEVYSIDSNGYKIYDIPFSGSGEGMAFRDGQAYQVRWQRGDADVVSLLNPDGTPFPFKPGNTWFEVLGTRSTLNQTAIPWRFQHVMP
jgi:hypothetical protein